MARHSSRRQALFREALARESNKSKKHIDRGKGFRETFPYGVMFLWAVFFGALVYLFLFSPYLFLTRVEVVTEGEVTAGEVHSVTGPLMEERRFWVFPAKNFFLLPRKKIEQTLFVLSPVIESVGFEKKFPHTLTLRVGQREQLFLWCAGGPCALVEEGGKMRFHEKSLDARYEARRLLVIDTSALPLESGTAVPVRPYLEYFSSLQNRFPHALGHVLLREATTPSRFSRELRLTTEAGWVLLVNIDMPSEETLESLRVFLEERKKAPQAQPLVSIDARVPGRIFFVEAPSPEEEAGEDSAVKEKEETPKKKKENEKKKERS